MTEEQLSAPSGEYSDVLRLAGPVVVTSISYTLLGIVDTAFIGRVGTDEQAAVGLAAWWITVVISFFVGSIESLTAFVAQHFGAGTRRECGRWAWSAFLLAAAFSLLCVASSSALERVYRLVESTGRVARVAAAYTNVRMFGAIFDLLNRALYNFMIGIGDTRTPAILAAGVVLLNIPLDYLLIFGGLGIPGYGAVGSAYASVIASAAGTIAGFLIFFRPAWRASLGTDAPGRCYSAGRLLGLLKVGLPIGVFWLVHNMADAFFLGMVGRLGASVLAAQIIVQVTIGVSVMMTAALGVATTTIVGQAIGAGDRRSVHRAIRSSTVVSFYVTACVGVLLALLGSRIAWVFNADPVVISAASGVFVLAAFFQVVEGIALIREGALLAAGRTVIPMVVSAFSNWCVFVPIAWYLMFRSGDSLAGGWLGRVVGTAVLAGLMVARTRGSDWHEGSLTGS